MEIVNVKSLQNIRNHKQPENITKLTVNFGQLGLDSVSELELPPLPNVKEVSITYQDRNYGYRQAKDKQVEQI